MQSLSHTTEQITKTKQKKQQQQKLLTLEIKTVQEYII